MSYCDECPLNKDIPQSKRLGAFGPEEADIIFVTPPPTDEQVSRDLPMTPKSMKYFTKYSKEYGIDYDNQIYQPCIQCSYDKTRYTTKENTKIYNCCKKYTQALIDEVKPKLVVPFGAEAAKIAHQRAVKISKVRGRLDDLSCGIEKEHKCKTFTLNNPAQISFKPETEIMFSSDMSLLASCIKNGYNELEALGDLDYSVVDDLQFMIDDEPPVLCLDGETIGTDPFSPEGKLLTLQFCYEKGKAYNVYIDHPQVPQDEATKARIRSQLKVLLENPKIKLLGQNLKFDIKWIKVHLGLSPKITYDTIAMASLLDENYPKNLSDLVKRYVPEMAGYCDEFDASYDKSRMDLIPLDDLVQYGCGDVDATFRLYNVMKEKFNDNLTMHYRYISKPGLNMFVEPELNGMKVNLETLSQVKRDMAKKVQEDHQALLDRVHPDILKEHELKGASFTRPDFTRDVLFTHPKGLRLTPHVFTDTTKNLEPHMRVPSTSSKAHLPYFFDTCPFTVELAEWVKINRLLSTNIVSFENKYVRNGYIRPSYQTHVTTTGRPSSKDPNGQNIPKHGKYATLYRSIFDVEPGWVLIEADYSQAELRIIADVANEKTMLGIYNRGEDIHAATGAAVFGLSMRQFRDLPKDRQKEIRKNAKAVNFGFIYGMIAPSFVGYAKTLYGLDYTIDEAYKISNEYFRKYPALKPWHARIEREVRARQKVVSYTGRERHLPNITSDSKYQQLEAIRQGINSPIQETGASLGVLAMSRIDEEICKDYFKIFGFVHDAIYVAVPEQYLHWGCRVLQYYMETNPIKDFFGIDMKVHMSADVSISTTNLSEMQELDGFRYESSFDFSPYISKELIEKQETPPNNGEVEVIVDSLYDDFEWL